MTRTLRATLGAAGFLAVPFGLACLSYLKPGTLEHHARWAAEHDVPAPGDRIMLVGALALVTGAALMATAAVRR